MKRFFSVVLVLVLSLTAQTRVDLTNQVRAGGSAPGLVAGSNVTITGTWPNQTVSATGGGGGGGANALGSYFVAGASNSPVNAVNVGALTTGLLAISVSGGVATPSSVLGTNGHCAQWTSSGLGDSGSACGSGGGGVSTASQLTDFQVTKTSGTVLTAGASCNSSTPCIFRLGSVATQLLTTATATISSGTPSGTLYWYIDASGTLTAGHNFGGGVITCSNCTAVNGISSFPINSIPIYTWTATTGVWNSAGSDYRSVYSSKVVLASSGISINEGSGSSTTVSVDQSVVSLRVSVPANSSSTCTTGTFAASSSYYYFCISTNTWVRAALATF